MAAERSPSTRGRPLVAFRMEPTERDQLFELAAERGISVSDLARDAVRALLTKPPAGELEERRAS